MQIRQQYNADIMNELGITGEKQSDFEQKIRKIKMDTDDALGHRQEKMHIDLCGLSFYLPLSLYRPIEILCKQQDTDYPFLHEKYGKDLIRALLSHYLAGDAELNRYSKDFVLKQAQDVAVFAARKKLIQPDQPICSGSLLAWYFSQIFP